MVRRFKHRFIKNKLRYHFTMKKTIWMGVALMGAFAMGSCKSGESVYKKAYEKAQAQQATTTTVTPVNTTDESTTVSVTPVQAVTHVTDFYNVKVMTEDVTMVNGAGLKAYSVVVGSFGIQANAIALQNKLNGQGYQSQVVKSPSNMYRVIISTHPDKTAAIQERNNVISTYEGAWILYQK